MRRKNSSRDERDDTDAEGEIEYVRGYAFTDAVIIPMNDILDNGHPPPSRAGNMTSAMDLMIFIQDLKHIPTVPGGGNTSHYNCEVMPRCARIQGKRVGFWGLGGWYMGRSST